MEHEDLSCAILVKIFEAMQNDEFKKAGLNRDHIDVIQELIRGKKPVK